MRDFLGDNPVRVLVAALAVVLPVLTEIADELTVLGDQAGWSVVGLVVIGVIGERFGKLIQGHNTEPKAVIDALIARMEGESQAGFSSYVTARANNETDPHGPDLP